LSIVHGGYKLQRQSDADSHVDIYTQSLNSPSTLCTWNSRVPI